MVIKSLDATTTRTMFSNFSHRWARTEKMYKFFVYPIYRIHRTLMRIQFKFVQLWTLVLQNIYPNIISDFLRQTRTMEYFLSFLLYIAGLHLLWDQRLMRVVVHVLKTKRRNSSLRKDCRLSYRQYFCASLTLYRDRISLC